MQTLIIESEGKKLDALISVLKALEISFKPSPELAYDEAFVQKIKESEQEAKEGKTTRLQPGQNIWDLAITE